MKEEVNVGPRDAKEESAAEEDAVASRDNQKAKAKHAATLLDSTRSSL